jgi:hypothetical protein
LIIDHRHARWAVGTGLAAAVAVAAYVVADRRIPGGLTGGTTAGLWFGVIGTSLMLYVGLLSALRKVPGWSWLGSRQTWLRGHIWVGLLSVVVIACHSGFRSGGPLETGLWVVLGLITLSGLFGLLVQQSLPAAMTRAVPVEVSYDQMPHYCAVLRDRADELFDALTVVLPAAESADAPGARFAGAYESVVRPAFGVPAPRSPLADGTGVRSWFGRARETLRVGSSADSAGEVTYALDALRARGDPLQEKEWGLRVDKLRTQVARLFATDEPDGLAAAARSTVKELRAAGDSCGAGELVAGVERGCADAWLAALESLCAERAQLRTQERYHRWLHGWLMLHVPLSAALLVLTVAHIVMSLYY